MKAKIFCVFFLALVVSFLTACQTATDCDGRGGSDGICELHHSLMHTEKVKNYNLPPPSPEYVYARRQGFIHSYPFMLPDQCKTCAVYICADCVQAEKEWKRRNKE